MSERGVVLKYIAIAAAALVALAALLIGALALVIVLWAPKIDLPAPDKVEAQIFCPRLDPDGSSIWIAVWPGYEMVVVATGPTDAMSPLVPSPGKIVGEAEADFLNVEIGAAAASRSSIVFDRPPADGDVVELRLGPVPVAPGTVPVATLPPEGPFANPRYVYTFTGGRFAPTGVPEPCLDR